MVVVLDQRRFDQVCVDDLDDVVRQAAEPLGVVADVGDRESLEHLVEVERVAVAYISHDPEGFSGLAHYVVEVVDAHLVEAPLVEHHHHDQPQTPVPGPEC